MPVPLSSWELILSLSLLAVALLAIASCNYGHRSFVVPPLSNAPFKLMTVQVDDYGTFWDPAGAEQVLDSISRESESHNTIVLLYVHGWHHSAKPGDSNLLGFQNTLRELTANLEMPLYAQSRSILTGQKDVRVIGVYVGWRGRSLPGVLDYSTIWPRKAAAERVGSGDLREFVARLQKLYEDRNRPGVHPFMGLVTTGHSLGGQVLFKAVADQLERELITVSPRLSVGATDARRETVPVATRLRGVGDIAVLLNPALEAYQFERIHQLAGQLSYNCLQTPTLVVISGEDDSARQVAFPLARSVNRLFRPGFRGRQRGLWRTALGEYEPQRTHRLETSSAPSTLLPENYLTPAQVLSTDFAARIVLGGAELTPVPGRTTPFSPVIVAYSSRKLIQGHNGIFTDTFRQFLTDYVAFIEGKRMLIRSLPALDTACGQPGSTTPQIP